MHSAATHLVFPLKLRPHAPELHVRTAGWADVVHDVDMDVVQHNYTAVCIGRGLIHYVAEDGTCLCGRYLDVCPAET